MKNVPPAVPSTIQLVRSLPLRGALHWLALMAAFILPFPTSLHAETPPTTLRITPTGTDIEGLKNFGLEWNAIPNATYLVERADALSPGSRWQSLDAVWTPNVAGSYQISVMARDASGFYRLVLPQPQITGVEPAVVDVSVPDAQIYILGQCLPANALVLINGLYFTPTIINSGGVWARVTLNGLPPGEPWFDVAVVDPGTGAVLATLAHAVLGVDASSPYLLGPPEAPPASPAALWLSKKGYDYYRAQSDMASAGAYTNPAYQSNNNAGEMVRTSIALWGSKKGYDYYQAQSSLNRASYSDHIGARPAPREALLGLRNGRGASVGKPNHGHLSRGWLKGGGASVGKPKLGRVNFGYNGGDDDCDDSDWLLMPALMKAKEKANRTMSSGVSPFSGEVSLKVVDFMVEGRGLNFVWARTYNSRIGRTGASVNGWTFSYDVSIQAVGGNIVVRNGTGRADTFTPNTSGVYTCPEFFSEGTITGGVFRLTFADTGYWEFNPLDAASDAKLARIVDRNGNTITLNYEASGRLAQIVDDLGRTNTVAYNSAGQLASITDFSGRTVTYEYYQGLPKDQGGAGDLKSVTSPPVTGTPNGNDFPAGKTVTYTYTHGYPVTLDRQNHLLLSCVDALGVVSEQFTYDLTPASPSYLRCVSMQHWTNTPTMISYLPLTPAPPNQFAVWRCIVNDPVGNVTECFFDARGRCVRLGEFTGYSTPGVAVTDTLNRPAGKRRQEDTDVWWRTWSWNNDSLCTSEIFPGGEQRQFVYESDFDKTTQARKRADCRVVREIASSPVDLDGDGVADTSERVSRFAYDPRFGSNPTASRGKKLYVGNLPFFTSASRLRSGVIAEVGAGRPATVGRARGIVTTKPSSGGTGSGLANKTAALSAIGSIPMVGGILRGASDLSASGARLGSAYHDNPEVYICPSSTDLGGDGFVIFATDPRGNVTTGEYDPNGNCTKSIKQGHYAVSNFHIEVDGLYNSAGQLTAITNAPDANGYRRVDTFAYSQGQMTECVVDAGGLALTESYEHDVRGNLTRCIDPLGNDTLYTYNALDQLVQASSAPLSNGGAGGYRIKTQFSYDANDNLMLVAVENRDAAGTLGTNAFWRTQFVYDGGQRLTGCWRDKNGALVLRCTEVSYNAANQVVLYRSPEAVNGNDASNTVAFAYDERRLIYRMIGAPGSPVQSTMQCDYDASGNVTRVSEGLEGTPSITMIEYDGFAGFSPSSPKIAGAIVIKFKGVIMSKSISPPQIAAGSIQGLRSEAIALRAKEDNSLRLSKITDPMGNVTTFHHDANDNLKVVRDLGQLNDVPGSAGNIRLAQSRYEYDGLDRPVRSRDSFFSLPSQANIGDGERTTTFAYAPNSECTSITDDLGRVTTFAYDTACRPSSVTSPGGKSVIAVFRDQAGNVTQTTQTDQPDLGGPPQVFAWANVYDALNRPISTTDNVGNSSLFAYDSRDNCVSATDANGNETVYGYDGLSRTVSYTVAQGAASSGIVLSSGQFAYDDNDRCISSTDANGNVTLHTYDSLDRLTQTTQADGTHHRLVWSPRSNVIQETDANGTVINRAYDLNDRCIASNITPGAGVASTTTLETFAYDGASRLASANNDGSQSGFEYDSLGNCTRDVSGGLGAVTTYDSVGNRLSLTYPGGRVLTYAYDVLDQCTNLTESGASLASFSYAGPGRVARVIRGNGTRTQVTYDGIAGTPNSAEDFGHGQIRSVTHGIPGEGGPQMFAAVSLKWDRNGNKSLRTDTIFAPAIPRTHHLGLQYDAADRLTRATVISDTTILRFTIYGLDLMGNRTNVTGAASCSGPYHMDGMVPGPMDFQMNQYTSTPCEGRSYDENGNLVSRSAGPDSSLSYAYDYAGRLVSVAVSGRMVVGYGYDALGRRVFKTVLDSSGLPPVTTQFVFNGGRVIEERENGVVGASFVLDATRSQDDGVIQMRRGGQNYYYHTDDQGNVLALSGANGVVVERCDFDDYGAVTFLTSDGMPTGATSSSVGNPYCWHGRRLDAETGLQNDDGAGYLETQSGRCLARAQDDLQRTGSIVQLLTRNNPWSSGGGSPSAMQKGTVKFFNEAKGF